MFPSRYNTVIYSLLAPNEIFVYAVYCIHAVLFSERTNSNDIQPGTEDEDIIFPRMNELHGIVTSGSAPAAVKIPAALLQYNFDGLFIYTIGYLTAYYRHTAATNEIKNTYAMYILTPIIIVAMYGILLYFAGNVSVTNVFFRDMHHLLPTIFEYVLQSVK